MPSEAKYLVALGAEIPLEQLNLGTVGFRKKPAEVLLSEASAKVVEHAIAERVVRSVKIRDGVRVEIACKSTPGYSKDPADQPLSSAVTFKLV